MIQMVAQTKGGRHQKERMYAFLRRSTRNRTTKKMRAAQAPVRIGEMNQDKMMAAMHTWALVKDSVCISVGRPELGVGVAVMSRGGMKARKPTYDTLVRWEGAWVPLSPNDTCEEQNLPSKKLGCRSVTAMPLDTARSRDKNLQMDQRLAIRLGTDKL